MANVMKGNFKLRKEVLKSDEEETLEDRFEKEALKKLGGSIAYVSKKKAKWVEEDES